MKNMKKLLSCVFALVLVLSTMTVAFATETGEEPEPTETATALETELTAEKDGENVVLTLITNTATSFGGLSGALNYDTEAFTLTDITSEVLTDCESNLKTGAFAADLAEEASAAAGDTLLTFTLEKTDAFEKNTEYTFTVEFDEAYNFELEDLTVKNTSATYAENVFTVTFDSDGGSEVEAQEVEENATAEKPADPTKEGFTFKGWQLDGKDFDFSTPITEDITLKAVWEKVEETTPDEPEPKPDDESPKTGDNTLALYGVLMMAAVAGTVVLARKKVQ